MKVMTCVRIVLEIIDIDAIISVYIIICLILITILLLFNMYESILDSCNKNHFIYIFI